MLSDEFNKRFLKDRDHTGRYIITSFRTGRTYYIEPIGFTKTNWGDLNPATGKVEGKYGQKYRGSIDEKESLIKEENDFSNIVMLEPGYSPEAEIDRIDATYPDKVKKCS